MLSAKWGLVVVSDQLAKVHRYLGYVIHIDRGRNPPFLIAYVTVSDGDGTVCARFKEQMDDLLIGTPNWPADQESGLELVTKRGYHRARGAILLDRLAELDGQEFTIPIKEKFVPRSPDYIQELILRALDRAIRLEPESLGYVDLDDLGICLLESIETKEMEYVLAHMVIANLIEPDRTRFRSGARVLRIKEDALHKMREVLGASRPTSLLIEGRIAEIERRLERHSHGLVRHLRDLARQVQNAETMGTVDVGTVAQQCRLIIQEFLDIPALWKDVGEAKPDKEQTRNRLRMILATGVKSETERELIQELEQYLSAWFRALDKFINKYRHPKDVQGSTHLHARRLILYTYMLLGDLVDLLDL